MVFYILWGLMIISWIVLVIYYLDDTDGDIFDDILESLLELYEEID